MISGHPYARAYMDRATGTALRAEAARKPVLGPRFPQAGKSDNCGLPFGRAARTIWRAREAVIGMVSAAIRRVHVDLHKFFFCSIRAHACSAICLGAPIPTVLARIRRSLCQASRHIKGLLGGFALASMLQSNGCRLWGQGGGATL
jgi:hypothetical protein